MYRKFTPQLWARTCPFPQAETISLLSNIPRSGKFLLLSNNLPALSCIKRGRLEIVYSLRKKTLCWCSLLLYLWQMHTKLLKRKQAQFILIVAKLYLTYLRKYKTNSQVPNGRKCGKTVYVVPSGKNEALMNVMSICFLFFSVYSISARFQSMAFVLPGFRGNWNKRREEYQPQALPPSWRASVSLSVRHPTWVLSAIMSEFEHLNLNWKMRAYRYSEKLAVFISKWNIYSMKNRARRG